MWKLARQWVWIPGLLCGTVLGIGCGGEPGDMDDDGVTETIEVIETAPEGIPSTDMGETPGPTNPTRDVDPDKPGLVPDVPIDSPPYQPGETKPSPASPDGATTVEP